MIIYQDFRSFQNLSSGFSGLAIKASPAGENPEALSDEEWADYVFYRTNLKGDHWEQWVHTSGCRKYFLVKRSTISHEVIEVATFEEIDSENAS